jgi:polyhydroxybutyrate depolymerase
MKKQEFLGAITCLLALAALAPPALAQDGSLRERIQERRAQRQQARAANEAAGPITTPGDHRFTLRHDGLERMYRVHVPASYHPTRPAPVLFAFHGGGGNMDYQANDAYYGLISKSEREGFIAVFPNGYSRLPGGKFATWNAGACCGAARDRNVDDVGFVRELFGRLQRQLNVDRSRVFATGMSNGGLMAYRLACELPEVFSAIAPVAGTDNTLACSPSRPVSVLHIHAKNDSHVLFEGGAGPDAVAAAKITDFSSVPATIAKWTQLNGCTAAAPRRVLEKPGAYCELHAPCRGGAQVQLCVTQEGGHSWPGGHKPRGDEPPSRAISANDVMWEFFNRRLPR